MLSRTAENLYWLSRYVERAENIARLLFNLLPNGGGGREDVVHSSKGV